MNKKPINRKPLILIVLPLLFLLFIAFLLLYALPLLQFNQQQLKFSQLKQEFTAQFADEINKDNFTDELQYFQETATLLYTESPKAASRLAEIKKSSQGIYFIFAANKEQLSGFILQLDEYSQYLAALGELGKNMNAQQTSFTKYYELRQYVFSAGPEDNKRFIPAGKRYANLALDDPYLLYGKQAYYAGVDVQEPLVNLTTDDELFKQFLDFIRQNLAEELIITNQMKDLETEYEKKLYTIENTYGKKIKYTGSSFEEIQCYGTCRTKADELKAEYLVKWTEKINELVISISANKQQFKDIVANWVETIR